MLQALTSLIPGLFKLGSELIEDPDKKTEFAFKTQELYHQLATKLLDTKTYPWVDALVKLAYASEAIVKGLIRPLGSFVLAGFAAYCQIKGIELSGPVQALLYGAPAAWGYSRHKEKQEQAKTKTDPFWME